MRQIFIFLISLIFIYGCQHKKNIVNIELGDRTSLEKALKNAQAGDEIILADGVWKDMQLRFEATGTVDQPIILKAATSGKVFIEGKSDLKFGGEYLQVEGLYFRNGFTPSNSVIDFKIDKNKVANHCTVKNCVIEDFNQMSRDRKDHWVEFWGRHNTLERCYLSGKSNEGPTVRVELKGNQNIRNHHQIIHNHFGPRPRKGGPRGETIQLGDSYSSMSPGNTKVAYNLFEKCNGEVEVISSKTNYNEFSNNVFYLCEGSLVTRHGNYCKIDGNFFIGDGESENYGGIRLINTGHWVTNNYFYKLKGENFRSPLAVMNGIPKSQLNRYNQVTDAVIAYNSWLECSSPFHFGVGVNIDQKDVLPKSEIRSARPIRTLVANNIISHSDKESDIIVAHDKIDGIKFKNNYFNGKLEVQKNIEGLDIPGFNLEEIGDFIFIPGNIYDKEVYQGFEFEQIDKDIFGNSRTTQNAIGAVCKEIGENPFLLNKKKYGPDWFSDEKNMIAVKTIEVAPGKGDLNEIIANASDGDILQLKAGDFMIKEPLIIDKIVILESKSTESKAKIFYKGKDSTPLFQMHPKGKLIIKNIDLTGTESQYAFASLKENMSSLYYLKVEDCSISGFDYVLKAYKESFADEISFTGTRFRDCKNGIELSPETNDRGDYNVEFLNIVDCEFENIDANVVDYYRGGYDESTIGGNLKITDCIFTKCGSKEENRILLNTRGIVNVELSNNKFIDNKVKLVALLWGAKNNFHSGNEIKNSGKLVVEENLKQTLMY